jgi:phosphohistidine phosphatase
MNRLILLRHGDAERDSSSGEDIDRKLSKAGQAEAAAMGARLAELGLMPDHALVSGAVRTRQTWTALAVSFPKAQAQFEGSLYLADAETLRESLREVSGSCDTAILIGHNPGLQELALSLLLSAHAPASAISRMRTGFPTAAAAVFLLGADGVPQYDGLFYPHDAR